LGRHRVLNRSGSSKLLLVEMQQRRRWRDKPDKGGEILVRQVKTKLIQARHQEALQDTTKIIWIQVGQAQLPQGVEQDAALVLVVEAGLFGSSLAIVLAHRVFRVCGNRTGVVMRCPGKVFGAVLRPRARIVEE